VTAHREARALVLLGIKRTLARAPPDGFKIHETRTALAAALQPLQRLAAALEDLQAAVRAWRWAHAADKSTGDPPGLPHATDAVQVVVGHRAVMESG
jgi:hypothetical protein